MPEPEKELEKEKVPVPEQALERKQAPARLRVWARVLELESKLEQEREYLQAPGRVPVSAGAQPRPEQQRRRRNHHSRLRRHRRKGRRTTQTNRLTGDHVGHKYS